MQVNLSLSFPSLQACSPSCICFCILLISVWDCLFNEASHTVAVQLLSCTHLVVSRDDQPQFSACISQACVIMLWCYLSLFFSNLAELLILFRIKPCNLSRACLLMIHDISCFVSFIGTMVPDDFAHLHVAHPVQGTSYHSRQQHILSAVSLYSVSVPAFHVFLALFYPMHLIFTIFFFSCIKWHVKQEHDSERCFCSGQL